MAPMRSVRIKARSEPWINPDLLAAIKDRDRKYFEYQKCKTEVNKQPNNNNLKSLLSTLKKQCNKLRNKTNNLTKSLKKNYINDKIEENTNKPRELWKILNNQLPGCSQKLKTRLTNINIKEGDALITDKIEVASRLNIFFTNIATTLVNKLSQHSGRFGVEHIKAFYRKLGVVNNNFKLEMVSANEVLNKLSALHPNKATSLDNIPSRFLMDSATTIAPIITHIINLSIKQGQVPKDFKIARVTPLYKKGSKLEPGNYRPVSILSSISKVMEKIVYEQVDRYLATNKLMYKFQSGFRTNHSTDTCLLYLTDHIKHEVDAGKYCGMVMLDIQKAFDTVNHAILFDKLRAIGFDETSSSWMQSYLEGRKQVVEVNSTMSPPLSVSCGVPQGSILGPLLFLIYVNDMPSACHCELFLFADDSALLVSGKDKSQVEQILSAELLNICTWLADNKLSIHLGKTESILFGSHIKLKKVSDFTIKVGDIVITRKDEITYLGSILEANLSCDKMATKVIKKVNQRTRFLYRISSLVNKNTLRILAGTLIQPFFDYACTSWYPSTSKTLKSRLQTFQNKLIRLLLDLHPRSHLNPTHFSKVGWLRVEDRVKQLALSLVYKIRYTSLIPKYMSNYFLNVNDRHNHNTRGSSTNHVKPRFRSNKGLNSFSFYATSMWNALPTGVKVSASLYSFKTALKQHLQATSTLY
ncbi:probable RNA-directed DNA polymerase from transposon BS isoform X1 [Nerophis ophidion]|uniref:probable RNA-directed DNA polymerase from transposon BS isoform X1 n=1 Tax=Nerophis ophidion TaxID=159077 RepID=UPI002ADF629A|nr:probable RNA-directed DNA polymerase from transposon BS isoform X1 [Nerophis ophidion]